MAADNKVLGQFDLMGIPPSPRGMPQIEVTFDIDANGIVNVSAKDKATGKEQQIRIQASGGLSEADIQKMVKDAEANAAEDKKRRDAVDAKNHADSLVHSTEKALAEHGSKVEESERRAIEDAVSDLKEALKGDDAEAIKTKTKTLAQASMKLGEAMYKQQAESDAAKDAAKDDVVDAEFTEVDNDKNKTKTLAQASMKLGEAMYKQQAESDAAKDAAKDDVVDAEFTEVDNDKNNKKSA